MNGPTPITWSVGTIVLYAGTLGIKHNPRLFIEIAKALQEHKPGAAVVAVSEGRGRIFSKRSAAGRG
jgi:colanic acid biosynthesis glycosyl transferase WcaI